MNLFGSLRDKRNERTAGAACPAPYSTPPVSAGGFSFVSNSVGRQIVKATVWAAALVTSAASLYAISFVGLALLGY